ncbi:MAG: hypothetical protein ACRDNS_19795, partial [Trebonia sp.]
LGYYLDLGELDYQIPQHGADVFGSVLAALPGVDRPTLLDVCCSYGVGGALLTTDLSLVDLYKHYRRAGAEGVRGSELAKADAELLAEHRVADPPHVIGLDVAPNAARYALDAEMLEDVYVENLEDSRPSERLARRMDSVDMITTTGGVGYVTERTFARLLDATDRTPWVAAFCLRAYDYGPVADTLADRGLVTERGARSWAQRRFRDEAEQTWAMHQVAANGLDPQELEADGHYYADFYLSRPAQAAQAQPLPALLAA